MENNKWTEFKKCPNCSSELRFAEQLAGELKSKGWAMPDFTFCLQIVRTPIIDKRVQAKIPIGSSVPGMHIHTDICMECGTVYAVRIMREDVKKTIAPNTPHISLPGDSRN